VKGPRTLCASLVLVAGCTAHSGGDTIPVDPTSGVVETGIALDCNAIGDDQPPPDYLVVLDRIALPAPEAPALQTHRQQDSAKPLLSYFAKTGLGFKAGSAWSLRVGWRPDSGVNARALVQVSWG